MKIKEGFVLKTIAGSTMVVPIGRESLSFKAMIKINDTGAFLWQLLEKGAELEDLVSAMTDVYDITREAAAADAADFVKNLKNAGILADA